MRRILSTIFAILLTASAFAQSHGNHIMVGVGGSYPQGVEATLAYEHETEYHNAWEYFATAYLKYKKDEEAGHVTSDSFWHNYNTWTVGAAYKPCVTRGRNHHGSVRIGVSCGRATTAAKCSQDHQSHHKEMRRTTYQLGCRLLVLDFYGSTGEPRHTSLAMQRSEWWHHANTKGREP